MKKYLLTLALSSMLLGMLLNCSAEAQDSVVITTQAPVLAAPATATPVAPAAAAAAPVTTSTAAPAVIGEPCADCVKTKKICVSEEKKQTKIEHGSRCKDYCLPSCALCNIFNVFKGNDGCSTCQEKTCGKVRSRRVLVKYVVDDCPKKVCVVKEVIDDTPAKCETVICQPAKCDPCVVATPCATPVSSVLGTVIIEPATPQGTPVHTTPVVVTEPPLISQPLPAGPAPSGPVKTDVLPAAPIK